MVECKTARVQEYDQREFAAEQGKYQGVRHCTNHVTADIHTRLKEIISSERRICRMHFLKGGRYAHGNVHDSTQSTYYDACHQETSKTYLSSPVFVHKQGLCIIKPKTVDFSKILDSDPENHSEECTGDCTKKGADSLPLHSTEDRKADQSYICADNKCRDYCWCTFEEERDQYKEQADDREYQPDKRLKTCDPADKYYYNKE